jgi:hypothetical protein
LILIEKNIDHIMHYFDDMTCEKIDFDLVIVFEINTMLTLIEK